MRIPMVLALVSIASTAHAGVFKCVVDGETIYSDTPCAADVNEQLRVPIAVHKDVDVAPMGLRPGELEKLERVRLEELVKRGRVAIGMTPDQVQRAWGAPATVNRSITAGGVREQWVYRYASGRAQYVYVENGKVSSLQE